jgi:hypothetical protein
MLEQSAAAAERMGWLARAVRLHTEAGFSAYRGSAGSRALASFEAARMLHVRRGDQAGEAGALVNIGIGNASLGDLAKALVFYERGLALAEKIGHRQWQPTRSETSARCTLSSATSGRRSRPTAGARFRPRA